MYLSKVGNVNVFSAMWAVENIKCNSSGDVLNNDNSK